MDGCSAMCSAVTEMADEALVGASYAEETSSLAS
jgi:hypothetical protein